MSTDGTQMAESGKRTAQDLVKEIAKERGYLGEEQLARIGEINPELRREVEEALLRKDEMIGSAVLTLAKNLYTSNARFVFELLQNADDNDYSTAVSQGQDPYVSFKVHPDKVTIECNENGFTHENLKAICAIGKSSKVGAAGYIGEKGIGFKSVFMAAWKVHIQSNDFSFSFTHRKGDSGLGMVTPVWEETKEPIVDSSTRITLLLHTSKDPDEDERRRDTIRHQFQELQHTILLFLRKLRKVQVSFYDKENVQTATTVYSLQGSNPATIRKETSDGVEERQYHVTKHVAENIPRSENRTYSDERDRADSSAEVVLAFPLTDTGAPIIENQDVFAFLPMRPMGFKFLIHTDFVTEASRQGIVVSSLRNRALLQGIADCLVKAIEEFCRHPTLQYQWMRWLPQRDSYPWDSFWSSLLDRIKERIHQVKVLRTLGSGRLGSMFRLRNLYPWLRDEKGDPLFKDIDEEIYLAKEYTKDDLALLEPYGLQGAAAEEIILRIEHDLQRDPEVSSMKRSMINEDGNSLAARALLMLYRSLEKSKALPGPIRARLEHLRFIPLQNGGWVSASCRPLYYSHSSKLEMPDGLGLALVDAKAASNPDRRALLDKFGVVEARFRDIRLMIIQKSIAPVANDTSLHASISCLKFMYLSEALLKDEEAPALLKGFAVYDHQRQACQPVKQNVYLPSDDKYGPRQLLSPCGDAPGFDVPFLHDEYLLSPPATPQGLRWSWEEWLELRLRLRRNVRLGMMDKQKKLTVSSLFRYIEQHRPDRLLGALQRAWSIENINVAASGQLIKALRSMKVPCKSRDKRLLLQPLLATFMPLPELEGKHSHYAEDENFLFLDLGEPIASDTYRIKWGFLVDHLGVGHADSLNFHLFILWSIRYSNATAVARRQSRILDLYEVIHTRCRESDRFLNAQTNARTFINRHDLVYIPAYETKPAAWVTPDKCLWDARKEMQTAYPLSHLYRTTFHRSEEELDILKQFFKITLGVKDCSWENYLDELRSLRTLATEDFNWVNDIYNSLKAERPSLTDTDTTKIRKAFAEEKLIYSNVGNVSHWYTVSECLWSSATQIRGKVALNDLYPDLEDFFVNFLGVQELTLSMAYDELKEMGNRIPSPPIAAVKDTIWALNSLLVTADRQPDERPVLKGTVFPVKYPNGSFKLQSCRTEFAIVDRKALGDIFGTRAKTLDFTLDEVRRLQPFLSWLNMGSRYLSTSVREISTVASEHMNRLQSPDREIKQKADGLYRIAVHYNSPRTQDDSSKLHWILANAEVYETDGISSELHLSQDGQAIVHIQEQSDLHIREDNDTLKIYVPREPKAQGFCYYAALPRRLLEWIMTDPSTLQVNRAGSEALQMVAAVLNAPLVIMAQILEAEGIIDVSIPTGSFKRDKDNEEHRDTDESNTCQEIELRQDDVSSEGVDDTTLASLVEPEDTEDEVASQEDSTTHQSAGAMSPPRLSDLPIRQKSPAMSSSSATGQPVLTPASSTAGYSSGNKRRPVHRTRTSSANTQHGDALGDDQRTPGTASNPAFVFGSSPAMQSSSAFQFNGPDGATLSSTIEDEEVYMGMIDNVIASARKATIPRRDYFGERGLFSALPEVDDEVQMSQRFRSYGPKERDMRIGALGELYVFELLRGLNPALSHFGRDNWQSRMRKFINVHPTYSDMPPWNGQETADIVYFDRGRELTRHLVEKRQLRPEWLGLKPWYLIEVKSTTGDSRTPFYLSKRQYEKMGQYTDTSAWCTVSTATATVPIPIYLIARVSNVGKTNIHLDLYIYPATLRVSNSLVFTPESWSVVPGPNAPGMT
ncbi:hypothetical protein FPOAC2_03723 [Fusarium poae]|uniref:hypothetical protein n=1 Tax=Fusarium poae TaxID=36050 RepID=UPI001CE84839|nr:hypothetical protein FPOAC1_003613 [Fusarium poae]KAG8677589.1 hypothetical protein FPOAC1_003613 [Fusarium poae]